jgi:hypothetical protein
MTESQQTSAKRPRRRIFIVRPWHSGASSLYPPVMDGIEYIDAVIHALREAFPKESYEVRVDADVFVPGESLRANVEREITDAEIVLVLLDGLRPNVVYELGMAHALQRRLGAPNDSRQRRVIPLAEANATVLVRNFYPMPLHVPMRDGSTNVPLNPPLNLAAAWSDGSDILVQRYDRLRLQVDITSIVSRLVQSLSNEPAKGAVVADAVTELGNDDTPAESEGETEEASGEVRPAELGELYRKRDYAAVVERGSGTTHPKNRKLVALAFMKLGRVAEAMELWSGLQNERKEAKSALFHLGVCNYAINEFGRAYSYFQRATSQNYGEKAEEWLRRTADKLGEHGSDMKSPAREDDAG